MTLNEAKKILRNNNYKLISEAIDDKKVSKHDINMFKRKCKSLGWVPFFEHEDAIGFKAENIDYNGPDNWEYILNQVVFFLESGEICVYTSGVDSEYVNEYITFEEMKTEYNNSFASLVTDMNSDDDPTETYKNIKEFVNEFDFEVFDNSSKVKRCCSEILYNLADE